MPRISRPRARSTRRPPLLLIGQRLKCVEGGEMGALLAGAVFHQPQG